MRLHFADTRHAKRVAKSLRHALLDRSVDWPLRRCQDVVAEMFGYPNWDALQRQHAAAEPSDLDDSAPTEAASRRSAQIAVLIGRGIEPSLAGRLVDALRPSGRRASIPQAPAWAVPSLDAAAALADLPAFATLRADLSVIARSEPYWAERMAREASSYGKPNGHLLAELRNLRRHPEDPAWSAGTLMALAHLAHPGVDEDLRHEHAETRRIVAALVSNVVDGNARKLGDAMAEAETWIPDMVLALAREALPRAILHSLIASGLGEGQRFATDLSPDVLTLSPRTPPLESLTPYWSAEWETETFGDAGGKRTLVISDGAMPVDRCRIRTASLAESVAIFGLAKVSPAATGLHIREAVIAGLCEGPDAEKDFNLALLVERRLDPVAGRYRISILDLATDDVGERARIADLVLSSLAGRFAREILDTEILRHLDPDAEFRVELLPGTGGLPGREGTMRKLARTLDGSLSIHADRSGTACRVTRFDNDASYPPSAPLPYADIARDVIGHAMHACDQELARTGARTALLRFYGNRPVLSSLPAKALKPTRMDLRDPPPDGDPRWDDVEATFDDLLPDADDVGLIVVHDDFTSLAAIADGPSLDFLTGSGPMPDALRVRVLVDAMEWADTRVSDFWDEFADAAMAFPTYRTIGAGASA